MSLPGCDGCLVSSGKNVFYLKKNPNNEPFLDKISCLGSFELWIPFLRGIRGKAVENDGLLSSPPARPPRA